MHFREPFSVSVVAGGLITPTPKKTAKYGENTRIFENGSASRVRGPQAQPPGRLGVRRPGNGAVQALRRALHAGTEHRKRGSGARFISCRSPEERSARRLAEASFPSGVGRRSLPAFKLGSRRDTQHLVLTHFGNHYIMGYATPLTIG